MFAFRQATKTLQQLVWLNFERLSNSQTD